MPPLSPDRPSPDPDNNPVRLLARQFEQLELRRVGRTLALSGLVGAVAGLGAIVFQLACQAGLHFILGRIAGYEPEAPAGEPPLFAATAALPTLQLWLLPLIPAAGGLISGILVQRYAPEAAGHGTDAAIEAFHRRGGAVRGRVPLVKTLASALTLGSGGSGGREGPIAQIGAGFGSFLATRLGLSERERRILLAAGVGAGVGSIFRAPLAGALFAAEVLYSDPEFESEVIIPAALSTITAYCVFSLKFGFGSLFQTPSFAFRSAWELIPYAALALITALAAGLFVNVFYRGHALFARFPLPRWSRPMVGGLGTGLVAAGLFLVAGDVRVLDVLAFGYGTIQQAMEGQLAIGMLLAIALGKMLTTTLSIGSGGSGGVFGPSMVIGGALGGAVGLIAQRVMPGIVTQPGAFVPVGMAGFFAAAANTPISTLVMVSEMTGNYHLLLPSLWVCALSYLIGRRWKLYRSQVPSRVDSPAHRGTMFVDVLEHLSVGEIARDRPVHTLPQGAPLADVIEAFLHTSQHWMPVVDGEGRMTGIISMAQVRHLVEDRDEATGIIAHDVALVPPKGLTPTMNLAAALQHLVAADVEELPVVSEDGQVLALLSRRDLIAAYNRRRLESLRQRHPGL